VALLRDFGWEIGHLPIDYDLMQREAKSFIGEHDFIRFCIPRNDGKSTLCNLTRFELIKTSDYMVQWHIQGNRFLHRQVRAMVGTLFDVGRGRYPEGTVNEIFADRFKGERTMAPPQALVLEDVIY
jgi:tRNA pseudouridine38-40 synthase